MNHVLHNSNHTLMGTQLLRDVTTCTSIFTLLCVKLAETGVYRDVYEGIIQDPENIVIESPDAYEKVKWERYAYINDETPLRVEVAKDCRLTVIPELFYPSGFGIVVPEGWPYKHYFDKS